MANTVWKGQLTFGLVSFPVRLVRAARKERILLRYVREVETGPDEEPLPSSPSSRVSGSSELVKVGEDAGAWRDSAGQKVVEPVRRAYVAPSEDDPVVPQQLQRGYEVAPGQFAVVRSEELRQLRQQTSSAMAILRSVRMDEIDPVFLETSYYVLPGNGGEKSYGLFYRALKESSYAALAEVAMHGRQHVVVIRSGAKGLIAHTMFYVNEVRQSEEFATETKDVGQKELDLAKRFVEAIAEPFRPEEFSDRYREKLESLLASKEPMPERATRESARPSTGKVIDIMDALRKSLEQVTAKQTERKPVEPAPASAKPRKRRA